MRGANFPRPSVDVYKLLVHVRQEHFRASSFSTVALRHGVIWKSVGGLLEFDESIRPQFQDALHELTQLPFFNDRFTLNLDVDESTLDALVSMLDEENNMYVYVL